MNFNLKEGLEAKIERMVSDKDTAASFGSGNICVFATPMMIGIMENAALNAVDSELGEGYSTVGIHVDVKHLAATPVGMKVTAKALLTKIDGKKLYFNVEAYDEKKKIGEGTHIRYIIEVNKFLKNIDN